MHYVQYIKDVVHGEIGINKIEKNLLADPIVNRLNKIIQLGRTDNVYPGGRHKRLEHSIGAMYLAYKMINALLEQDESIPGHRFLGAWRKSLFRIMKNLFNLGKDESKILITEIMRLTGFLHDLGHLPHSHSFEKVMKLMTNLELTEEDNNSTINSTDQNETAQSSNSRETRTKFVLIFDFDNYYNIVNLKFEIISIEDLHLYIDSKRISTNQLVLLFNNEDKSPYGIIKHELFGLLLIKDFLKDTINNLASVSNEKKENVTELLLTILGLDILDYLEIEEENKFKINKDYVLPYFSENASEKLKTSYLKKALEFLFILNPLHEIISSEIDADRLDYVQRDILMTGLGNGGYDLKRIISSITIVPSFIRNKEDYDHTLPIKITLNDFELELNNVYSIGIRTRALSAVTAYYITRFEQYKWIIFHPVVLIIDKLFEVVTFLVIKLYLQNNLLTKGDDEHSYVQNSKNIDINLAKNNNDVNDCITGLIKNIETHFINKIIEFVVRKNLSKEIFECLFAGKKNEKYTPYLQLIDEQWFSLLKSVTYFINDCNVEPPKISDPFVYVEDWQLVFNALFYRENLPIPLWRNTSEFNLIFIPKLNEKLMNKIKKLTSPLNEKEILKKKIQDINGDDHQINYVDNKMRKKILSNINALYLLNKNIENVNNIKLKKLIEGLKTFTSYLMLEYFIGLNEAGAENVNIVLALKEASFMEKIDEIINPDDVLNVKIKNIFVTKPIEKYLHYQGNIRLINDFGKVLELDRLSSLVYGMSDLGAYDFPPFIVYFQIFPLNNKTLFHARSMIKSKRNQITEKISEKIIELIEKHVFDIFFS